MNTSLARDDALAYGWQPRILLIADGPSPESRAAIETAGARVVLASVEDGVAWLDGPSAADGIIVELANDPGPALEAVIARLNVLEPDAAALVIVPVALTDRAWSASEHPGIVLIAAPDAMAREVEIGLLVGRCGRRRSIVAEPSARLRQLSEEMARIAQLLGSLSDEVAGLRATPSLAVAAPEPTPAMVRGIIRARRLRDRFFGGDLFADPAWDMLLDLMAARLERRQVAVSSLCIAAAVPPTTALRWIRTLTQAGLFERRPDPEDGRRMFIAISDHAADAMAAYLAAAAAAGTPIG